MKCLDGSPHLIIKFHIDKLDVNNLKLLILDLQKKEGSFVNLKKDF